MIQVNFKAKHCYWAAGLLKAVQSGEMYPILKRMSEATEGVEDNDQVVSVSISGDEFCRIYPILSGQPEGLAAKINDDMDTLLASQVAAGISANNEEWQQIAAFVTEQKTNRAIELAAKIEEGKTLLTS